MGTGFAAGENRAENAVKMALDSPLLDNTRIRGAQHLLVNFAYGHKEPVMSEISKVKKFLQEEAGHTAHLKMGITKDDSLGEDIAITVIATGFEVKAHSERLVEQPQAQSQPMHPQGMGYQPHPAQPGLGYSGKNPYANPSNPAPSQGVYGTQTSLFHTPPAQPSVVNHVPSSFSPADETELDKTEHTYGEDLNPINVAPKAFEGSDDWNEDPMGQIFRDTRLENGRSNRESLLDNEIEIPAYMRKGINLEAAPPSQSQLVSKITIGEEDPMNARDLTVKPNRHLHDNVD